ncbi:hypothetical protein EK904_001339 [Melospiza melodia maxima]|nr:hypothetical protein EK904_001339 [Melospiza melodia maxima]
MLSVPLHFDHCFVVHGLLFVVTVSSVSRCLSHSPPALEFLCSKEPPSSYFSVFTLENVTCINF